MIEDVLKIGDTMNVFFTLRINGRKRLVRPLWNLKTFISGIGRLQYEAEAGNDFLTELFKNRIKGKRTKT